MKINGVSRRRCYGRRKNQAASLLITRPQGSIIMSEILFLALPEDEFRALGEDPDFVSGVYLPRGHQAIKRILKFACQGVLKVGSSIFSIAPVVEQHGF